ncbi:hypothetical protein [Nocardioides sp. MH1]|uniref:hypothetical protein n=1 Tax=Nocardioides sp. MH1 TaxID=3242490 RepID=UPI003521B0D2
MTAPGAVGVRASYAATPAVVRDWVDATLGSPVVEAVDQVGGMSPGCATRLRCADGTRAFVKAVGSDLNPDTPTLFRREIAALELLGSHPLWADLLAAYDDGDRVALLLEDVEGSHPDLADDATMERLVSATGALSGTLRERAPLERLRPLLGGTLYEPGLTDLRQIYLVWTSALEQLGTTPEAPVPGWVRAEAATWSERVRALAAEPTEQMVHWDIRVDNLLERPDGSIVFVDWGACGVGSDWLDPLLARLGRVHLPWFDRSIESSPELVRAGDDAVTAWLVGIGTNLAVRAVTATHVNLPTLAAFRRTESARFLGAAARRLGVGT